MGEGASGFGFDIQGGGERFFSNSLSNNQTFSQGQNLFLSPILSVFSPGTTSTPSSSFSASPTVKQATDQGNYAKQPTGYDQDIYTDQAGAPQQAGLFGGGDPMLLIIGVAALALMMFMGKKKKGGK